MPISADEFGSGGVVHLFTEKNHFNTKLRTNFFSKLIQNWVFKGVEEMHQDTASESVHAYGETCIVKHALPCGTHTGQYTNIPWNIS